MRNIDFNDIYNINYYIFMFLFTVLPYSLVNIV